MSKFAVLDIPFPNPIERISRLEGAIDKYWIELPDLGQCLVKVDLRGAWVEKITATLAEQIGLPVARCELGQRVDGVKLIVSPNFLTEDETEFAGEKLLIDTFGDNYFYSPENILSVLDNNNILLPQSFVDNPVILKASDLMVGYLIFDSWIGNIEACASSKRRSTL